MANVNLTDNNLPLDVRRSLEERYLRNVLRRAIERQQERGGVARRATAGALGKLDENAFSAADEEGRKQMQFQNRQQAGLRLAESENRVVDLTQ